MPSLPTQEISYEQHFQDTLQEGREITENLPGPIDGMFAGGDRLAGVALDKLFADVVYAIAMFPLFFIISSSVGPIGTFFGVLAYLWFVGSMTD